MKRFIIFCLIGFVLSSSLSAQKIQLTPPFGTNLNDVKLDDVPTPSQLKQAGFSDSQIEQLMKVKNQSNNNTDSKNQDVNSQTKQQAYNEDNTNQKPSIDTDLTSKVAIVVDTEKIFGHSFFKINSIKFYDKANQLKAPENYVLGIGDEVSVAIWGYSDFNGVFLIDGNGAINPKLVGRIYLNGLTFKDAKGLIINKFKSVYDLNNSQIDITLSYSKIITVNIVGEVNNPGSYTVPSINTAFNILATVGGVKDIGSVRKIYIKRAGKTIKILDIYEYLMNPDSKQDFFLENNDYILIPSSGRVVTINGQVKRPLNYELAERDSLKALIEYAGGFDADSYKKRIQIKRFLNSHETIIDIDYDSLVSVKKDFELRGGDEIFVRKIQSGYDNYVEIEGAVKLPGIYELKPEDKISDIVAKAEGTSYDVFDNRAYVIRLKPDLSKKYLPFNLKEVQANPNSDNNIKLQNKDVIKIFSKSYFRDEFKFFVGGTVRNPGDFVFGDGVTLKDALYLAGGLKKEAAKNRIEISRAVDFIESSGNLLPIRTIIKTVEVGIDLRIDLASEGFVIRPYDQVLVRTEPDFELQKNIVLKGEVMYPGMYPILDKKEKISDIIQRAGGLTRYAFPEGATLERTEFNEGFLFLKLQEAINDSTSLYNYIVKGGDTLVIPKEDQLIQIKGSIMYPNIDSLKQISAPFTKGKSARYYVNNYGLGFDENANKKETYVLESGGNVHRTKHLLFLKFSPKVSKGSTVVVPKKTIKEKSGKDSEPINWNKAIENFTVKLTGVATLWLLFTKLK